MIDETHDGTARSWVASANGHCDFPIQNLPFGIVSSRGSKPWAGTAIGDYVLDLHAAAAAGLLSGAAGRAVAAMAGGTLNGFFALGPAPRRDLRRQLFALLLVGSKHRAATEQLLKPLSECVACLPAQIGDYTDFFVGIHHAMNVGRVFRPDQPLLPNYKYVPIGYHGRASSVVVSGTTIKRPRGQVRPSPDAPPRYEPSRRLDYELELGLWLGEGNELGATLSVAQAHERIVGLSLLNDWSARDVQAWENQPLGPFLSKSFATTISPWVITAEALAPFRIPQPSRPPGDPQPLSYLLDAADQAGGALDIELEVTLASPAMERMGLGPATLCRSNASHMYWTAAQIVTHHASNGCNLRPGDLIGTGTISGPDALSCGALIERTRGGVEPVMLPGGESRIFIEDGDRIFLSGRCSRAGFATIGFGPCEGRIVPSPSAS
ncbi:fumarylacetoacetase [Novosphingobium sp.]|uniref:fumarylacetoacetase n=1 Tax=Novosphingobium sp. TaxID=1874826 RepID=UPI003B52ADFB